MPDHFRPFSYPAPLSKRALSFNVLLYGILVLFPVEALHRPLVFTKGVVLQYGIRDMFEVSSGSRRHLRVLLPWFCN